MGSLAHDPKITLYTNYGCPWAHRAQIALHELGLEFQTEIIDLSKPRTPEYLAINPRGLVPSINYNGDILTESAVVSQFLVDAHPSHLVKSSSEEGGALQRARINFFVDTYFTKVHTSFFPALRSTGEEMEKETGLLVEAIIKNIEPLLQNAGPFFNGASRFTLAEVLTAPFVLRLLTLAKHDGFFPEGTLSKIETSAPAFWKWANAVIRTASVTYIWDEQNIVDRTRERLGAAAAK